MEDSNVFETTLLQSLGSDSQEFGTFNCILLSIWSMSKWVFLSLAIFSEVVATASLKSTEGFTRWGPSLIVLVGYCAAFYFLSLTLDTIPVGVAYAIWSGVGVATITIVSYFLYDQKIDAAGIVGISLIVIGVVILRFMSETGELAG